MSPRALRAFPPPLNAGPGDPRPARLSVAAVAEALREADGLVSRAAARLGCSPSVVRAYLQRSKRCAEARTQAQELLLDQVEWILYQEARKGVPWAVLFLLEHQARDRGYGGLDGRTERQVDQEVQVLVTYGEAPPRALVRVHSRSELPPTTAAPSAPEAIGVVEAAGGEVE